MESLAAGTWLMGRYEVLQEIGGSALSKVYRAHDHATSVAGSKPSEVAVKVEIPQKEKDGQMRRLLLQMEADILRHLSASPWTPRFVAFHKQEDFVRQLPKTAISPAALARSAKTLPGDFMVLELLGEDLQRVQWCAGGRFSPPVVAHLGLQMLAGIESVHERGLLHRDIKPANFVLGRSSSEALKVYLIDFGLARRHLERDNRTVRTARPKGNFRGTTHYSSPAALMQMDLGRCDDLWCLAYALLEMVTGALPWDKLYKRTLPQAQKAQAKKQILQWKLNLDQAVKTGKPGPGGDLGPAAAFLERVPTPLIRVVRHIGALSYASKPDYRALRTYLQQLDPDNIGEKAAKSEIFGAKAMERRQRMPKSMPKSHVPDARVKAKAEAKPTGARPVEEPEAVAKQRRLKREVSRGLPIFGKPAEASEKKAPEEASGSPCDLWGNEGDRCSPSVGGGYDNEEAALRDGDDSTDVDAGMQNRSRSSGAEEDELSDVTELGVIDGEAEASPTTLKAEAARSQVSGSESSVKVAPGGKALAWFEANLQAQLPQEVLAAQQAEKARREAVAKAKADAEERAAAEAEARAAERRAKAEAEAKARAEAQARLAHDRDGMAAADGEAAAWNLAERRRVAAEEEARLARERDGMSSADAEAASWQLKERERMAAEREQMARAEASSRRCWLEELEAAEGASMTRADEESTSVVMAERQAVREKEQRRRAEVAAMTAAEACSRERWQVLDREAAQVEAESKDAVVAEVKAEAILQAEPKKASGTEDEEEAILEAAPKSASAVEEEAEEAIPRTDTLRRRRTEPKPIVEVGKVAKRRAQKKAEGPHVRNRNLVGRLVTVTYSDGSGTYLMKVLEKVPGEGVYKVISDPFDKEHPDCLIDHLNLEMDLMYGFAVLHPPTSAIGSRQPPAQEEDSDDEPVARLVPAKRQKTRAAAGGDETSSRVANAACGRPVEKEQLRKKAKTSALSTKKHMGHAEQEEANRGLRKSSRLVAAAASSAAAAPSPVVAMEAATSATASTTADSQSPSAPPLRDNQPEARPPGAEDAVVVLYLEDQPVRVIFTDDEPALPAFARLPNHESVAVAASAGERRGRRRPMEESEAAQQTAEQPAKRGRPKPKKRP
eukprot:TRINITY_DN35412_c0_g1_i1.p1 TRINITY_DN35412_c0_g1~~TRINITY_DN35412_c0_g1_i1.p1  ORF type:complete len:1125 (+),score=308.93 TRINITY_DN35412_c0_g1_i1:204-3578(+)